MKIRKKISKALLFCFLLAFLVLFSLSGYAQADALAGCCCDLSTGTAQSEYFLAYTDCLATNNFVLPNELDRYFNRNCDQICAIRAGIVEEDEFVPVPTKCGEVGYTPAPERLRSTNIKGENHVMLVWESECPADFFIVTRCFGSVCIELSDQVTETSYLDDSGEMLWDEDYTYNVIAHYNLQGDSDEATIDVNTGDIECWRQYGTQKFCISRLYYEQFGDYFTSRGYRLTSPGDFLTNFTLSVNEQFFDKFNLAYYCDGSNKLSSPEDICAVQGIPGGICIADEGGVSCITPSACESVELGGIFGLFYVVEECEGTTEEKKYCYLDRSKSIVDKCYPCVQDMSCYDYRSSGTCERDNCGLGECTWREIYPAIGIGVCVDQRVNSCHLCDARPTGASSEAFNEIFEQCSEEKSEALSTTQFPCYWKNWQSFSCDEVSCKSYKRLSECASPAGGIQLYQNNSIRVGSNDICDVGVCQWREETGECLKNADGDTGLWPDCTFADEKEQCELDYVPPETDFVAAGALGVYDKININIFDKISRTDPGEYKTGSKALGYTTYFCHYPEGQQPCDVHSDPISTAVSNLALNFLSLHNTEIIEAQTMLTQLSQGYNYIRYYSIDSSKNPGTVKEVRVYACARCVGPQIINYVLENGIDRNGKLYTNSIRPILDADFDVDAEITTAEIDSADGMFVSSLSYDSVNNKNYTFVAQTGLDEGNYVFRINAKDDEGTYMNEEFVLSFTVDLSAGDVDFIIDGEPAAGALITKEKANVEVIFAEPVISFTIMMGDRDITVDFSTNDDTKFSAQNFVLDEGTVVLSVRAEDLANNIVAASTMFYVNARSPIIKLKEPTYGVSDKFKFDIVVETLNTVDCRYLFDVPVPANFSFEDLEQFDSTGGNLHTLNDFTRISDGDYSMHILHAFCVDPLWGMNNASFEVSVDVTKPEIIAAYADPDVIKEAITEDQYRTIFKLKANELAFCKYSKSFDDYDDMEETFPDYKAMPALTWPNDVDIPRELHAKYVFVSEQNTSYRYYAACENLAGLVSDTKTIDFSVNLNVPFGVESRTLQYWNASRGILSVETNKRAYCYYGRGDESITSGFQEDGEYVHKTFLTNLPLGEHTFYVRCNTRYLAQELSEILPVTFIVDTTPAVMEYVDDSGPLPAEPQYSYFKNELRAKWLGKDNESPVTRYYYTIETFYGKVKLINWTASTVEGQIVPVKGLNLADDTTYRFLVKPENAAGLMGEPMESDGITVDFGKLPDFCNDSFHGANETDVDCGGICPSCAEGAMCLVNIDCQSGFCDNLTKTCIGPSCDDGLQNGDETAFDCGGSCDPCGIGALCLSNEDCETGNCQNGICAEFDPCFNGILDGTETDMDCGGGCVTGCENGQSCLASLDCASGLCIDNMCEPKKGEGESCQNDTECVPGLICKEGICKEKKKLEGEACAADRECDEGLMCYQGRCAPDSDGDGMPDEYELAYGLDPNNPADAMLDADGDTVSNYDEFSRGTDPTLPDTDGDKWSDGKELRFGTDPLSSVSKPSMWLGLIYHPWAYWWLWLIIVIVLAAAVIGAVYGRKAYKKFQEKKAKEKEKAKVPKKLAVRVVKKRPLTPEEKKKLAEEAEKDREIAEKLEKVKEIIEERVRKPAKPVTKEEWVDIRKIAVPAVKKKPGVEPVFEKLEELKKGKLGLRGRKKALKELERLVGKKVEKLKEEAKEKEEEAKKKKLAFVRLEELEKRTEKKRKEKEKARKKEEETPLGKLRLIALSRYSPEERREILEKFMLLRTGKLSAAERKKLFEKLRITAEYYKKHKKELEKEFAVYGKKKAKRKKIKKSK